MEEELFPYSRVVDPEEVRRTPCFTTLPVRVNRYDHLADEATRRFSKEWAEIMEDGQIKTPRQWSEKGNYSSYFYPESRPERLGLMAYLTELAFVHDGLSHLPSKQRGTDVNRFRCRRVYELPRSNGRT